MAAQDWVLPTIWALFLLSTVSLGLRIWCRRRRRRPGAAGLLWDDHVLVAGWGFAAAANVSASVCLAASADPDDGNFAMLVSEGAAAVACALAKTAFCVAVLRLLLGSGHHREWRWLVWGLVVSINMAAVLLLVRQCARMCVFDYGESDVRLTDPLGKSRCWPNGVVTGIADFYMAYSAVTDLILSLIPLQLIRRLQLSTAEKAGAAMAVGCGVMVSIVPLWKLLFSQMTRQYPAFSGSRLIVSVGLDIIEPLLIIIAQSAPILRILARDQATGHENSKQVTDVPSRAGRHTPSLVKSRPGRPRLEFRAVELGETWEQIPSPSVQACRRRSVAALYEMGPVRPYPAVSSVLITEHIELKEEWS